MTRSLRQLVLLGLGAATIAACADQSQQPTDAETTATSSTAIQPGSPRTMSWAIPGCASPAAALDSLKKLTPQLFKGGANGRRGRVVNLINDMENAQGSGNTELAEAKADSLINITLQDYYSGSLLNQNSDLAGTQQRVVSFITYLYCYNDLSPLPDFEFIFSGFSRFIRNETPTTIVADDPNLTLAAVKINQGQVPQTKDGQPFYGTLVTVVRTTTELLPTDLDWYGLGTNNAPGFRKNAFRFTTDPEVTFQDPNNPGTPGGVLTGVCVDYDDLIVNPADLRVAHGVPNGYTPLPGSGNVVLGNIEILAPRDGSALGIDCDPAPVVASTGFGRALQQFARLVLPTELQAGTGKTTYSGSTSSFSPFAAVDIKLNTTSTGPAGTQYIPLNATSISAAASVTVTTRNSKTGVSGIPVTFAASAPTGSSFAPTPVNTAANGTASSTWTLVAGTNTGSATPSKSPLLFTPASASFSVEVVQEEALGFDPGNALKDGTANVAYLDTLQATGGIGGYQWSLTGLPAGLTFGAGTGIITGTPTAAGTFTVNATVTSGAQSSSQSYQLKISLPAVTFSPTSLVSPITVGAFYSQTFTASGGAGAGSYTFALASGTLPTGLTLSSGGVLSGTPTVANETRTFGVTVTSSNQTGSITSAPQSYTLTTANASRINLAFVAGTAPSRNVCYAVNRPLSPSVQVLITDGGGRTLSGVTASIVAVLNNGSKVQVTPTTATSGANGIANFSGPVISQTGAFVLEISVTTPAAAMLRSVKFNVSPAC
jgi:hypothetical protein